MPTLRSLAELRKLQKQDSSARYEVDLQAQLSFAARFWNIFYIQDGDLTALVHCTDASTAILCKQPIGNLVSQLLGQGAPAPRETVDAISTNLSQCIRRDAQGRPQLQVTLPNDESLAALAETLARLLVK